jgi:uncharacterized protein (DUF2336 family)
MLPSAATATGGRRREALLRLGEAARRERLAAEDLARLERDRSADARAALAAKFGRLFEELCNGPARELAHAVLQLLAGDLAKEVRQALAAAVADAPGLPHEIARDLASDEIEIARPVLQHSPVLTDADLVKVVRTNTLQYALAVASRDRLSEAVSDALVDTGEPQVVARVIENGEASLSRSTLERVLQDHAGHAEVQARLVRRPELPFELVERLVGVIGQRLEWQLVNGHQLVPEAARALIAAVRERAAISFTARGHADAKLQQRLEDELSAGRLDHEELLRLLKNGEIAALEIGIGLHAELDAGQVRRLLYHPDRRHLAALCLAAGFPTPHYLTLRQALDIAEEAVATRSGSSVGHRPEAARFLQQQYETLRQDRARCEEFLAAARH